MFYGNIPKSIQYFYSGFFASSLKCFLDIYIDFFFIAKFRTTFFQSKKKILVIENISELHGLLRQMRHVRPETPLCCFQNIGKWKAEMRGLS